MASTKNHDYHILPPDQWPIIGSFSALALTGGGVMWMHDNPYGKFITLAGLAGVLITMFSWWGNVIREGRAGDHTPVVQLHLRYGMILFIASEVMFFAAFFWAFFDNFLYATEAQQIGRVHANQGQWPPAHIQVFDAWDLPFMNTLILLLSGTTVTWAHHAILEGNKRDAVRGLTLTVILGICFTGIQAYEYINAPFSFRENIYSSTFFMATGFHGFHVLVGTTFLLVCLFRAMAGQFKPTQHFGFEAAAWYWHFVDVVWLFLFFCIYWWGSGKAPIALH
jgi:cytochrome c oxidase subunit 3